jgi:membrane protease YdiL (CAAX protease family)
VTGDASGSLRRMRDAFDPQLMGIGLAAMFVLVVDSVSPVRRDYLFEPMWSVALWGLVPFSVAVLASCERRPLKLGVAAIACIAAVATVCARAWVMPTGWFDARPMTMLALVGPTAALTAFAAWFGNVDTGKWGVAIGDWRWWLPRFGVLMALIVPTIAIAAWVSPDLLEFYPEYKPARTDWRLLVYCQIGTGFYMLGWEYFYRGFLTFGVASRANASAAAVLQALPFLLLHAGKPEIEVIASYVGSVVLAAWCLRARTFLPSVLLHWGLNLTMEVAGFLY